MRTTVKNKGPRRLITYLPLPQQVLNTNESTNVDGSLDTLLALTNNLALLTREEHNELIEIVYDFLGRRITNVGTPTQASDLATKGYVDASVGGDGALIASQNLFDLPNAATARTNLGLGTAATKSAAGAGTAGAVLHADDSSTNNARTPLAHAASHNAGGGDALAADQAAGTPSLRSLSNTSTTACAGNDPRLSDKIPTAATTFASPYTPVGGAYQNVTMSNNMTINVPSGTPVDGQNWKGRLIVTGGDHVLTLSSGGGGGVILIPSSSTFTTPTLTNNKTYLIQFEYINSAWCLESFIGGYAV